MLFSLLIVPSTNFGTLIVLQEPLQTLSGALRMLATGGVKVAILTTYLNQFIIKFAAVFTKLATLYYKFNKYVLTL